MRHDSPGREFRKLRTDLERLRSDVNNLSGSLYHLTSGRAQSVATGLEDSVRRGNQRVVRGIERVDARGRSAYRSARDTLADRPFTTAAVAFGLGYAAATVYGFARRIYRKRQLGRPHRVHVEDVHTE